MNRILSAIAAFMMSLGLIGYQGEWPDLLWMFPLSYGVTWLFITLQEIADNTKDRR